MSEHVLEIRNLSIALEGNDAARVVKNLSLSIRPGETMCLVGESGSGKSLTSLATMGLLPKALRPTTGEILVNGVDVLKQSPGKLRDMRATQMAMIFQEPMTALNPVMKVGDQIAEVMEAHGQSRGDRRKAVLEIMEQVHLPDVERIYGSYPHQLSGGQRQRIMIAMALVLKPKLLIADEPTTALDVTIQAQILELLTTLQREKGMALILITHDMGVVAETAERVQVQYAGQKVEEQAAIPLFSTPRHPYTAALLAALPERATERRLPTIPGVVPGQFDRPPGCLFAPRCRFADERCRTVPPKPAAPELGLARCHYPLTHAAEAEA